jgi:hypothetical protein
MTEVSSAERPPRRGRTVLKGCAVAAGLFAAVTVLSVGFGIAYGLYFAFGATGGESIDPSQKARVLAEGISEALNCAAFAFLVLVSVATVIGALLWRRSERKNSSTETHGEEPEPPVS